MTDNDYQSYPLVDTAVGTRLLLGFIADPVAVQRRLPPRWQIAPLPAFEAMGLPEASQPNLLLAFHHLLLDQDAQGRALADSGSRFLVFDIPARHPDTGEHGLVHFQMWTGGAIPGRFRDALPAQVIHDYHLVEKSTSTSISEVYHVQSEAGGLIKVQVAYQRGLCCVKRHMSRTFRCGPQSIQASCASTRKIACWNCCAITSPASTASRIWPSR